ncbi:MAG: hypothetical protein KDE05_16315, partial [Parvularculaceae bacterium]|nr:hypothetical protein [Parvularculaceae bacterium]
MNQTFLIAFFATTAFCILWGRFGGRWYAKYLLKSAAHLPEQRHAPFINLIVYPLFAASLIGPWLYFI